MKTKPQLTDAQMRAFAEKSAPWILSHRWQVMGKAVGVVTRDGRPMVTRADDDLATVDVLFRAELTPETKTEAAIVEALLASATVGSR